jgi:hypothetical protein
MLHTFFHFIHFICLFNTYKLWHFYIYIFFFWYSYPRQKILFTIILFYLTLAIIQPTGWQPKWLFYGRWNPIFHPSYYIHLVVFRSKLIDWLLFAKHKVPNFFTFCLFNIYKPPHLLQRIAVSKSPFLYYSEQDRQNRKSYQGRENKTVWTGQLEQDS